MVAQEGFAGGCLCGGVRYRSSAPALSLMYCHCKDCQRCTGGPFAAVAVVQRDKLEVVKGETRCHRVTGEEGRVVFREFCPDCGSPLFSGLDADRRWIGVKAGSMDDSSALKPAMHIWTDSAVSWLPLHDDLPRWPRNPGRPKDESEEKTNA